MSVTKFGSVEKSAGPRPAPFFTYLRMFAKGGKFITPNRNKVKQIFKNNDPLYKNATLKLHF